MRETDDKNVPKDAWPEGSLTWLLGDPRDLSMEKLFFINNVTGDDTLDGAMPDTALLTIAEALTRLD